MQPDISPALCRKTSIILVSLSIMGRQAHDQTVHIEVPHVLSWAAIRHIGYLCPMPQMATDSNR